MSAGVLPPPSLTAAEPLRYIKFTRAEVDRLMDIGFFLKDAATSSLMET
jgi:hypothetical protein